MGLAGQCRRFPQVVTKAGSDWCGEHSPAIETPPPAAQTVVLPVVEAMTEGLDKPRKRGRPPKVKDDQAPA